MDETALPAQPDAMAKMTQANAMAAIVPQIMNAIGGGDQRTQQALQQQQQMNMQNLEKQKEQMFMRSVFSPTSGEITQDLLMQQASLYGIQPEKAMDLFVKFDTHRKMKEKEKMTKDATAIGLDVIKNPEKVKSYLDRSLPGSDQFKDESIFAGITNANEYTKSLPKPDLIESDNQDGTATLVPKIQGATIGKKPLAENLIKVDDGKGGWKIIKKSEGMAGMDNPTKGMRIRTNPDGTTTIETGVGGEDITKSTQTDIQKQLIEANSTYSDLRSTINKYDDKFLMGKDKLGFNITAFKEKWDLGKVSEQEKQQLSEYTSFKRDSISSLNNYIKNITGAAMSEQEAERLMKGMPNPGVNMFDGDSPTEFKSKMGATLQGLDRVIARSNYVLKNGLKSVYAVPLGSMGSIIDKRGEEIESEMKRTYPDKPSKEIQSMTAGVLSKEFGIRF